MKKVKLLGLLAMLIATGIQAQENGILEVGDAGTYFDLSKLDQNYPQMLHWMTAGVTAGIPTNDLWASKVTFLDTPIKERPWNLPGRSEMVTTKSNLSAMSSRADVAMAGSTTSFNIQQAMDEVAKAGGGIVILEPGFYYVNKQLNIPSGVVLRGSKPGEVTLFVAANTEMQKNKAINFGAGSEICENAGLENIILEGVLGKPAKDWNHGSTAEINSSNQFISMPSNVKNCWVDKTAIINSYNTTLNLGGSNCTIRDLYINSSFDKTGGDAYFVVSGHHNLITECLITHIRHFTLQGENCAYNVIYNNELRQEFSFHVRDFGHNLLENNKIILPGEDDPIEISGRYSDLGYPQYYDFPQTNNNPVFETGGKPTNYYAIMGTWSVQHDISMNPNVIFNNEIMEYNHATHEFRELAESSADEPRMVYGDLPNYRYTEVPAPWSKSGVVYSGPYFNKPQDHWINFPAGRSGYEYPPVGQTFYPVVLAENINPIDVSSISLPEDITIYPNETMSVDHFIYANGPVNPVFSVDNYNVARVDAFGNLTGLKPGKTKLHLSTVEGNIIESADVLVAYKPVDVTISNKFTEDFLTLPLNHMTNSAYKDIRNFPFISPTATLWSISGNGNKQMMLHKGSGEIETDYLDYGLESVSVDFLKYNADRGGKIRLNLELINESGTVLERISSGLVDGVVRDTLELTNLNIAEPVKIRIFDDYSGGESVIQIKEVRWTSHAFGNEGVNATAISVPFRTEVSVSPEPFELDITFTPENATMKNVVYTSTNSKIVEVTPEGLVAKAPGTAYINVTSTQNKNWTKLCSVVVK